MGSKSNFLNEMSLGFLGVILLFIPISLGMNSFIKKNINYRVRALNRIGWGGSGPVLLGAGFRSGSGPLGCKSLPG